LGEWLAEGECPLRLSLDKATASICICKLVFRCNLPRKHQKHKQQTTKILYTIESGRSVGRSVSYDDDDGAGEWGASFMRDLCSARISVRTHMPSNLILALDNNRINNAFLAVAPWRSGSPVDSI